MPMTGKMLWIKNTILSAEPVRRRLACPYPCPCLPRSYLTAATGVLCLLLLSPADAADIYTWQDEQGRVHFADKAESEQAEPVDIPSHTHSPSDPTREHRRERRQRLLDIYAEDRQERAAKRATAAAAEKRKKENCIQARTRLKGMTTARFIYEKTDNPRNPRIYSEAERLKAETAAQEAVNRWCG